jgi:uncharacterized protein (TIGR02646 family)
MRRIPQNVVPPSLTTLRAQGATYEMVRSDPSVRRALWESQGKRCAYCERSLRDPARDDHRTRIEHFHPQAGVKWDEDCRRASGVSDNAHAPTTWSNLLLCCDGNELAGKDFTCDKSKADEDICSDFRNPKSWHGQRLLHIDRFGHARPMDGLPIGATRIIEEVLNLNSKYVVDARKSVQNARRRYVQQQQVLRHGLTPRQRSQIAERFRKDAETSEYGSALLSLADDLLARS